MTCRQIPLIALLAALAAAPTLAGTVEVTVRDSDGRALEGRRVTLQPLATAGETDAPYFRRPRRPWLTDAAGKTRFEGLQPGTYAVNVAVYSTEPYVRPVDNPFAPAPKFTLFDESEQIAHEIVLWRGVRVTTGLELPDDAHSSFRVVFHHPGSGLTRTGFFRRGVTSIERVLPPGVWEVSVEPRPGYLLVALDRDRLPLPGHSVRLDLVHEPSATFLTWTYVAPAEIEGWVSEESGRVPAVQVAATLIEPGPWHEAVVARGGSIFQRLTASLDPHTGYYKMVVPDGRWRVAPVGEYLESSEPESVELTLAPGETGRADFTVREGKGSGRKSFTVRVVNERGVGVRDAAVEVYDSADSAEPLRSGVSGRHGYAELDDPGAGSYLLVAGHADYLEGQRALPDYDPGDPEKRRIPPVVLPDGAEIRLRATDPVDEPLAGVELTVKRLGDAPDLTIQAEEFVRAKLSRSAVTDQSGRTSMKGLYPGSYRLRAKLQGQRGTRGLIDLGLHEGDLRRELELEISGKEKVEVFGRLVPAASLSASLVCLDGWDMPDTVAVRVLSFVQPTDFVPDDAVEGDPEVAFADDEVFLTGRLRDRLTVGPFEQGIYYLALKPRDFDRWTWMFESYDPAEAAKLQVDVAAGDVARPAGGEGFSGGPALADVELGQLRVECAPVIDLLPAVAGDVAFPDVREVQVVARVFDLDADKELRHRLSIIRRDGRIQLSNCPGGRLRFDVTLSHPHFLPESSLTWQIEMELERGAYHQIVPEIEGLGGSIVISGAGSSAILYGAEGEVRRVSFVEGEAELISLVPGRYRLEIPGGGADGEPIRVWPELEVRVGETLRLDVDG